MAARNTDFDVIIVGGGAAGIATARRLASSGRSTLLLEAASRLGGRAWTQEIGGLDLDLGCGWLHSAEKNAWVAIAEDAGVVLDRSRAAWGTQYRDLGFAPGEQAEARAGFEAWLHRLAPVRATTDCVADALDPRNSWNNYIRAIVGFISGAPLESLSATDYLAYDEASTESNWRSPAGLGALVAGSFPAGVELRLATPVQAIGLEGAGVTLNTARGALRARAVVLTVSTAVLTGESLRLPAQLDAWREAARRLPLGLNEKLFLEITADGPFEKETQVVGDPRARCTGSYYIRPMDLPVIECFLGGESAQLAREEGTAAAFAFALDQLAALFGAEVRVQLRPLVASSWSRTVHVGGAYSYALPGQAAARAQLARPFDGRLFFAGEATCRDEFSTVHGAFDSGVRAAEDVIQALSD